MPDNYDAYLAYTAEQEAEREEELKKLPRCSECGKPIQEEECYVFDDELICEDCLNDNHKKNTEDYMED